MTYNEKKMLCKEINNDRIYDEIAHGIVCVCFKDIKGTERLQVFRSGSPFRMISKPCTHWSEDYITEWIINSTMQLNGWISLE